MNKKMILYGVIVLVAVVVIGVAYVLMQKPTTKSINSFAECVAAGNPVMESFPEQCKTADGKSFTNPDQQVPTQGY